MGLVKIVSNEIIEETIKKAQDSARGRAPTVLHSADKVGIRVIVNAIQPGSYIQPHLHEGDEAFAFLTGELEVLFF